VRSRGVVQVENLDYLLRLLAVMLIVGGFCLGGLSLSPASAFAANVSIDQCNNSNGVRRGPRRGSPVLSPSSA
jgi:hypothetical protein